MALKPGVSSAMCHFLDVLGGANEMCRKPGVSSAMSNILDGLGQVTFDTRFFLAQKK